MENEDEVFLNLVVQNILPSSIQQFMMSWLSQECKDFRIVFIDKNLSNKQKVALKYAQNFASVLWPYKQIVFVVEDRKDIAKAKTTKILKDTSELPNDKYEVSKLKTISNAKVKKENLIEENTKTFLAKPLQTYNPYLKSTITVKSPQLNKNKSQQSQQCQQCYDIVYVVGTSSVRDHEELRYSLRSIEKYAIGLKNVFIVGTKPSWLSNEAIYIPAKDIYPTNLSNKDRNIWHKLKQAFLDKRLNEHFLYGCDDFILTKPSEWKDFVPRHTGLASQQYLNQKPKNDWTKTRIATCKRFKKDVYLWHPHMFSQMTKTSFNKAYKAADYEHRNDVIVQTFYYNYIATKPIKDFDTKEYHTATKFVDGFRHMSHWDNSFNYKPFHDKLNEMFPYKSRYETNNILKKTYPYDFSIIVPCYNSAKYLDECLQSVFSNDFKGKYEVICVNDGSTDSTKNIIAKWIKLHNNIKLISHAKNLGLSDARNSALKIASGRFIIFLDSDDKLRKDYMRLVYAQMDTHDLDILYIYGESFFNNNTTAQKYSRYKNYYHTKPKFPYVMLGIDSLAYTYAHNDNTFSACLNVMSLDFIKKANLKYISHIFYEDTPFNIEAAIKAQRVFNITDKIYLRRVHDESIVIQKKSFKHFAGYVIASCNMLENANKLISNTKIRNEVIRHTVNMYMHCAKQLFSQFQQNKTIFNDMQNYVYKDVFKKFNQLISKGY